MATRGSNPFEQFKVVEPSLTDEEVNAIRTSEFDKNKARDFNRHFEKVVMANWVRRLPQYKTKAGTILGIFKIATATGLSKSVAGSEFFSKVEKRADVVKNNTTFRQALKEGKVPFIEHMGGLDRLLLGLPVQDSEKLTEQLRLDIISMIEAGSKKPIMQKPAVEESEEEEAEEEEAEEEEAEEKVTSSSKRHHKSERKSSSKSNHPRSPPKSVEYSDDEEEEDAKEEDRRSKKSSSSKHRPSRRQK